LARFESFLPENKEKEKKPDGEMVLEGIYGNVKVEKYPAWRYHKLLDPILVKDTSGDEEAKLKGYYEPETSFMSNKILTNWYWDIEDMSSKQLSVFAKDEYGVDLPPDASQDKLQVAVFELGKFNTHDKGNLVFMAHEIKMNYDETIKQFREMANDGLPEVEREVFER